MLAVDTSIELLLQEQAKKTGFLTYADFIKTALYAPSHGYYTQDKNRVGREANKDFYTSVSLGSLFGQLVVESIRSLCKQPIEYHFVEVGAEPDRSLLSGVERSPFQSKKVVRQNELLPKLADNTILFSNELLDAQPFHRLIYQDGKWHEIGVKLTDTGLAEALLPEISPAMITLLYQFPEEMTDGYVIDFPLHAERLFNNLIQGFWSGWVIFFDYGYTWDELTQHCPKGTGRAYFQHESTRNLLANPGQQDITCHICWDRLEQILFANGFKNIQVLTQEAFFVKYAPQAIEDIISAKPGQFDTEKQRLKELLHPSHMGRKFQVIVGRR